MRFALCKILICLLFSVSFLSISSQNTSAKIKPLFVCIFLSESCPICQSYTVRLKELYEKYNEKGVKFIGLFPNYYADADSVNAFKKRYSIPFDLIIDKNGELAKQLNAKITPQVFIETSDKKVLYSGRIDDSFYAVGKRRKVVASNDLDDALMAIINNKKVKSEKTEAVGCIINSEK